MDIKPKQNKKQMTLILNSLFQTSDNVHHASPAKVDKEDEEIANGTHNTETATNGTTPNMESYGTCAVALYDYQVTNTEQRQ